MTPTKTSAASVQDEVEDPKGAPIAGLESYPLDTLLIRSEPRAIADVLRRIDKGVIRLDPDFERDFIWDDERQSRLIESVLMRIPLPVFYLAEEKVTGKLIVVDGLQRLTTFRRFSEGKLALSLPNPELSGRTFQALAPKLKDRFEDGPLTFYLIDPQVPESVRLDIFERVNSGVALTRQQMRNALYNGPATRVLKELSLSPEFKTATGGSLSFEHRQKAMVDREAVNRFLAYSHLGHEKYGVGPGLLGDFDAFLGRALQALNAPAHEAALQALRQAFLRSMTFNYRVFGKHAFRKHTSPKDRRSALNLALFDVFSTGLGRYDPDSVNPDQDLRIRRAFYDLLKVDAFQKAISYATARVENVHTRFEMADSMLKKVLGAP